MQTMHKPNQRAGQNMSLTAFCLRQIQMPSWYGQNIAPHPDDHSQNLKRRQQSGERRDAIVKIIHHNGGRMSLAELADDTGWSMMSLRSLCTPMVDEGRLSRTVNKDGRVAYETRKSDA